MATKAIVPRSTGEGGLGTDSKLWGALYARVQYLAPGIKREIATIQTTDGTITAIWTLALSEGDAYAILVKVTGVSIGTAIVGSYGKRATVRRLTGAGATFVKAGTANVVSFGNDMENKNGLDATIAVSGNNVQVTVKGIAATTMNWTAVVETIKAA